MSIVGVTSGDMGSAMDQSRISDQQVEISDRLKQVVDEGLMISERLTGVRFGLQQGTETIRELKMYEQQAMFMRDSNAYSAAQQREQQCIQMLQRCQMEEAQLKSELSRSKGQERILTAQEKAASVRVALAEKSGSMFQSMTPKAISNVFGQG